LNAVVDPRTDLNMTLVLERGPSAGGRAFRPAAVLPEFPQRADYRQLSDEHAQVRVTTGGDGVLLVRNPWDENWHATLDGKPVPLLHADYVMQGVAIPAGTHTVDLSYRDTAIGVGLWVSGMTWAVLFLGIAVLRRRDARSGLSPAAETRTPRSAPPPGTELPPAG
jgi:hypothetical protein